MLNRFRVGQIKIIVFFNLYLITSGLMVSKFHFFFFQKETFKTVRNYAESIKELLGISQLMDRKTSAP